MWNNRSEYFDQRRLKLTRQYSSEPGAPRSAEQDRLAIAPPSTSTSNPAVPSPHDPNREKLFATITAFISTGLHYQLPEILRVSDTWVLSRLDIRETSRLLGSFGGRVSYDIDSGISHFIATEIPGIAPLIWLLRRNADVNVGNIKYKFVHPSWLIDSIRRGELQNPDNYRLEGDVPRRTLDEFTTSPLLDRARPPALDKVHSLPRTDSGRMMTSEENPSFVKDYFSNSRLHHLSSWKAKFQEQIAQYLKETTTSAPKRSVENTSLDSRFIAHIDMDAFFVTVSARFFPEHAGKPCVVAHGGDHSEISSCNYEARQRGIRNGMWMGAAKQLSPDLVVLPYRFDAYEEVSKKVFATLVKYSTIIQVKSCDEALVDFSHVGSVENVLQLVSQLRKEILDETGCVCSAGIANNVLLARLALKKAKPNGVHVAPALSVDPERKRVAEWIAQFDLDELPSVGWNTLRVLKETGIATIASLQQQSRETLMKMLGKVNGSKLFDFCRGVDYRPVEVVQQRQSIAVELNYAIRFTKNENVSRFVHEIADEVQRRLMEAKVRGRKITVTVMRRKPTAKEPSKFLGHGWCDTYSRSGVLDTATFESHVIAEFAWSLYKAIECPPHELRGLGIHVTDLESEGGAKVDRKRKREAPTASQPTLAKVLLGATAANNPRVPEKVLVAPSDPLASAPFVAPAPARRTSRLHRGDSSDSDEEVDDAMDIDLDDHPRAGKAEPAFRLEPAVINIDDTETSVAVPKSSIRPSPQLFFHLPRSDDETVDMLVAALSTLPALSLAHTEFCQQLISQWVGDCNLPAVASLLAEVEALAKLDATRFLDLAHTLKLTAELCTQASYAATLRF